MAARIGDNFSSFDLQITARFSSAGLEFLGVWIYRCHTTGLLETREFRKETAKDRFVKADSHHPPHTFTGIVKSQAQRLRRLCSLDNEYAKALQGLEERCENSGYNVEITKGILAKAKPLPRRIPSVSSILDPIPTQEEERNRIFWVTAYSRGRNSTFAKLKTLISEINTTILSTFKPKIHTVTTVQPSLARLLFNNRNVEHSSSNRCGVRKLAKKLNKTAATAGTRSADTDQYIIKLHGWRFVCRNVC